jgi:hypothetical protein
MADKRPDVILGPVEVFPGKGYAWSTARILQLKNQINEAAGRGDFDKVDELQKEIQDMEHAKTDALRGGEK